MYYSRQNKHIKQLKSLNRLLMIIGFLILILFYPLSFILPITVSFENNLLENLQLLVLILGSIYNLYLIGKSMDKQIGYFHIWCAVLMIFIAFRELSWGRVFFQIGMEENGPVFVPMSDFKWNIEVHVLIVITILFLIIFMLRNVPLSRMFNCHVPYIILFFMILAIIFSYIGDKGLFVGKLQGQIIEEMGELALYVLSVALCIHYHSEL